MSEQADIETLVAKCRENLRAGRSVLAGLSPEQSQALLRRYSRFEDARDESGMIVASEVVVHALRPPRPFLHLMASNHYRLRGTWGTFWDGTRGGFSCLDSALAGKMTSHLDTNYVPTAPEPQDVRDFWVHEGGRAWPMFPVPGHEEEKYRDYQCRQGMDVFALSCRRAGLNARLLVHVPLEEPLEVWELTLANPADSPRRLSWFCRLRVCLDSYPAYYFCPRVVCEGVCESGALVFLNHDQNNKHPRHSFFAAEPAFDGYDMMSETFDGWSGRAVIPAAVARGACFNSPGLQPAAGLIAAAQFDAELPAGGQKTWAIAYGLCSGDARERSELIARVRRELLAGPERSRAQVAARWGQKVLADAIDTPDEDVDRYFNVWSKVQARSQVRFCHGLDKIGYRDILQHALGVCDFEAPFVRARLAEALRYQFPDGRAVRQYEVVRGGGHDLRMYRDSPVWIPDTLVKYVNETGDFAFLDEPVAFLDAETLQPSTSETASVYDHAVRAVHSVYDSTGFHGLAKIGYGDWCDALSRIGGEMGVSVWLSCACVWAAQRMAELAAFLGRAEDAAEFREMAETMTGRINQHAWDGQWYIYAINRDGMPIGASHQKEGRLHLNVNTWALFAGVAAAGGREEQVWKSVESLDTPVGHVLLDPPYTLASRDDVGRIADMLGGQFENGSVYTHGESFYLFALVMAGKSDLWYEKFPKTLPSRLVPDITTGPPHQQSNYAVGPAHPLFGMNPFSNFTGSLAWYRRTIERVVGVRADLGGLRIDPRPPTCWDRYRVVKSFRGCRVDARLRRGKAFSVKLDGEDVPALIPAERLRPGGQCRVDVVYT